jgi:ABC transport system ATP-binding/permease protein
VVALLGDGKVTHLPGGIDEYLRRRAAARGAGAATPAPQAKPVSNAAQQRAARKEAARLERRMEALAATEERLHAQLVEAATDPERLMALDRELKAVVAEREEVELEWLAAAELAES